MADGRGFGTMINERRLALGYSLGQLANRVRATASEVRAWERGQRAPDGAIVARLAAELKIDAAALEEAAEEVRAPKASSTSAASDELATAAVVSPVFSDAADTASAVEGEESDRAATSSPPAAEKTDRPETGKDLVLDELDDEAIEAAFAGMPTAPKADPSPATSLVAATETASDATADESGETGAGEDVMEEPGDGEALADLPTEAVPIVPTTGDDAPAAEPAATVLAPSRPAPPPPPPSATTSAFAPFSSFLRTVFDPDRRYLFWLRTVLMVIVFLVFLRILASVVPAFFDTIGEILDTIESTPTDTTLPGG